MSIFAKVFIVINLILTLALVFLMATLLAQKADYKHKANDALRKHIATKDELKSKEADFTVQVENLAQVIRKLTEETNDANEKATDALASKKRFQDKNNELGHLISKKKIEETNRNSQVNDQKRDLSSLQSDKRKADARLRKTQELKKKWVGKVTEVESQLKKK